MINISKIFADTAHPRLGGDASELESANYIIDRCREIGLDARLDPFEVDMADIKTAKLIVDGREIECKGYLCAGCGEVEAPIYYLRSFDKFSVAECRGKIVLIDGYIRYRVYHDIFDNGALGFITCSGDINQENRDIDQRELRSYVSKGDIIPGVNINVHDAVEIVRSGAKTAKIILDQEQYKGQSHNVIAELPGEIDEYIILTAHYDTTSLSQGAYDNMSGSVGLLGIAEYFVNHPHRYGLRFMWCGSEERGLLGAKAYCSNHADELAKVVLDINMDMIGCIMGVMHAFCSSEEKLVGYIEYFGREYGMTIVPHHELHSSDSTPFADNGVPAISFGRRAPDNLATIHDRFDTVSLLSEEQMRKDIAMITAFTDRMANAKNMPVVREIPEKIKDKLDIYLFRKRP